MARSEDSRQGPTPPGAGAAGGKGPGRGPSPRRSHSCALQVQHIYSPVAFRQNSAFLSLPSNRCDRCLQRWHRSNWLLHCHLRPVQAAEDRGRGGHPEDNVPAPARQVMLTSASLILFKPMYTVTNGPFLIASFKKTLLFFTILYFYNFSKLFCAITNVCG